MLKRLIKRTARQHTGQIIALGGGGFSDQPDNLLLDEYVLLQTNKSKPRILFLPTAGGDHPDYVAKFYRAYKKLNCTPSHLELSKKIYSKRYLENAIFSHDAVFAGGGSPWFLMQVWRKSGLDKIMKRAWKDGIVLSGMSAGSICWFEDGFRQSVPTEKNPSPDVWRRIKCLGFLEGSFCPHYDKKGQLRKNYRKMISSGELESGYGVEDGVALHFIGTELKYTVSSVKIARAYSVRKTGFRLTEKGIKPTYLGILEQVVEEQYKQNEEKAETEQNSIDVVKEYIRRINKHDIDSIIELMTANHTFIDSLGIDTTGRENMRTAWDTYLTFFPDYVIKPKDFISKNGMVAVFGTASGTLAFEGRLLEDNKFEIPASWTAVVESGKIRKWRVYADNEPVRKLLEKYKK